MTLNSAATPQANLALRLFLRSGLILVLVSAEALYADTVVLTNGDKFTGEVQGLDSGKLTVKLKYADDPLVIDATLLASLTTDKELKATLVDGSTVSGKLAPATEPGRFQAAGSPTPVEFKNVTTIKLLVPELEPPKTWKDRLSTDNSITYTYTGNNSYQTFDWSTETEYYGVKWEPFIDLEQTFNGGSYSRSNRQSYGYLSTNYYLTDHLFIYPWLSGLKQKTGDLGYGSAIQSGGGIGWAFRREKEYRLLVQAGPMAERQIATLYANSLPGQTSDLRFKRTVPAAAVGFNWNIQPKDGVEWKTQLIYSHVFDSDVRNRNRLAVNLEASVPITGLLSLDFQVRDYANILRSGLLSFKTLYVSVGFSLSY
jgi:hypothetical protein